jgi:Domain of unknown function (DUF4258)
LSDTLTQIQALVARGAIRISNHGYDELSKDDISVSDIVGGINSAVVVEDYPTAMRGPSVLVLQWEALRRPVHVVWAIPRDRSEPAILVTAYRPDEERWSSDFMRRKIR